MDAGRLLRASIKIGAGETIDSYDGFGLIYLESAQIFGAPIKDYDKTSYAEEAGEHIDPRTVMDAFDFKIKFLAQTQESRSPKRVNTLIQQLNDAMFPRGNDGILMALEVTIYDYFKSRKIVGYPKPISEVEKYLRVGGEQIAVIELELRVTNPAACDFNYVESVGIGEMAIGIDFMVA